MASSSEMPCRELVELVTAYLDGALPPADRERFEEHGRICPGCRTHLSRMRRVVGSLGQLRRQEEGERDAGKDRLLGLFRRQGLHSQAPQRDEAGILLGHEAANARLLVGLERSGLDPEDLRRRDRLHIVSGQQPADALLDELDDRVRAAVDHGAPMVRVLGNLGWAHAGWPSERALLRLEAQVTNAVRNLPAVVICAYDVRGLPGRTLLLGGLECHPLTLRRTTLRANEHRVPAERFLEALARDGA